MKKLLTLFTVILITVMLMVGCGEKNPDMMPSGNGATMSDTMITVLIKARLF